MGRGQGDHVGTGQPITFQCPVWRRTDWRRRPPVHEVRLTGRTKPYKPKGMRVRMTDTTREYECLSCGHVGWSAHVDLARYPQPQ